MVDFGVELYAPGLFATYLIGCDRNLVGRGNRGERVGDGGDGVAVAHPHLRSYGDVLEQRIGCVDLGQMGAAVFARGRRLDAASGGVGDELGAVADAEHRQLAAQTRKLRAESFFIIDRERRAGEDHADDRWIVVRKLVVGQDFAILTELAHTASDELRGLRSEVENDYLFLHKVGR